jgi:molecular chaperone DnaK (HSP70)
MIRPGTTSPVSRYALDTSVNRNRSRDREIAHEGTKCMRKLFAIGCSAYDDPSIASLKYASQDAGHFEAAARQVLCVPPDDVVLLNDTTIRPGRQAILRHLSPPSELPFGSCEYIIVFYSGHGVHSPRTNDDYLIPHDGLRRDLEDSSISLTHLKRVLSRWGARAIFFLMDACRSVQTSGKATEDSLPPIDLARLTWPGCAILSSCAPGEVSYESPGIQQGLFTNVLIQALSDSGQCSTFSELNGFAQDVLPNLCQRLNLPTQNVWARVEPLGLERVQLVSDTKLFAWRATRPMHELRSRVAPLRLQLGTPDPLVAIDFGTVHSSIAVWTSADGVVLVPGSNGHTRIPSAVYFPNEEQFVAGWEAVELGRINPDRLHMYMKRTLGTSRVAQVGSRTIKNDEIITCFLRSLRQNAEDAMERPIGRVLLAMPARYSLAQGRAFELVCRSAGFDITRILTEPTAAALQFEHLRNVLSIEANNTAAVVDLGGGTFDVSIVDTGDGVYEVLAVSGDTSLGGIDYDAALYEYLVTRLSEQCKTSVDELSAIDKFRTRAEAERAKIALGGLTEIDVVIPDLKGREGAVTGILKVTRRQVAEVFAALDRRVRVVLEQALSSAKVSRERVGIVILAGEGSRVFSLQSIFREMFPRAIMTNEPMGKTVVMGLARQTAILSGGLKDQLLLDTVGHTVGLRCERIADKSYVDLNGVKKTYEEPQLSHDSSKNSAVFVVMDENRTIPASTVVEPVLPNDSGPVTLSFVERVSSDRDVRPIGSIRVQSAQNGSLTLKLTVDSNRTIVVTIADDVRREVRWVQLNNSWDTRAGASDFSYRDEAMLGWITRAAEFNAYPIREKEELLHHND